MAKNVTYSVSPKSLHRYHDTYGNNHHPGFKVVHRNDELIGRKSFCPHHNDIIPISGMFKGILGGDYSLKPQKLQIFLNFLCKICP